MGEGLKRAFAAARATRKKGKSMTGDGAVVRSYAEHRKEWNTNLGDLARAYLAQAAEIERLTRELEVRLEICGREAAARMAADGLTKASEASNADLLKALETMRDECQKRTGFLEKLKTEPNECGDITGLSAWGQCSLTDYTIFLNSLNAVLAAAKGETV